MRMFETFSDRVLSLDPTYWWLAAFVGAGLVIGILSGFFRARRIQPNGFKWRIFRHEILWTVINITVAAFTLGSLQKFLSDGGYIAINPEPAAWWVVALEFAAYFVVFDTWFYWGHRLMHVEPFYKWVHKTHHKSTATNPLTSTSVNPIEAFVNGSAVPVFMCAVTWLSQVTAISPIHAATSVLIAPFSAIMGFYVHLGYEFLPSWWNRTWLTKWFVSATFHDQHHRYFIGNFGGYSTVWDRLCGTMRKSFEKDFEKITSRPSVPRWAKANAPEVSA
jgi:sterol desaturase/sphingolipid hydroxylase (fatty acid hydroxylase superfamily)